MTEWNVLIVEDDATVARIHCRFVSEMRGFRVVGVAGTAQQALQLVSTLRPHLVLLDLGLPGTNGLTLLRRLRAAGAPVEVIAVTAAASSNVVASAFQLGVVDYLIKPFYADRLRQALSAFVRRMATMQDARLDQRALDRLHAVGPGRDGWLPREIAADRLHEIRELLAASDGPLTAADVGDRVGVARVTARRYLEYLVTIGDVSCEAVVHGRGRPHKTYRMWSGSSVGRTPADTRG